MRTDLTVLRDAAAEAPVYLGQDLVVALIERVDTVTKAMQEFAEDQAETMPFEADLIDEWAKELKNSL